MAFAVLDRQILYRARASVLADSSRTTDRRDDFRGTAWQSHGPAKDGKCVCGATNRITAASRTDFILRASIFIIAPCPHATIPAARRFSVGARACGPHVLEGLIKRDDRAHIHSSCNNYIDSLIYFRKLGGSGNRNPGNAWRGYCRACGY